MSVYTRTALTVRRRIIIAYYTRVNDTLGGFIFSFDRLTFSTPNDIIYYYIGHNCILPLHAIRG